MAAILTYLNPVPVDVLLTDLGGRERLLDKPYFVLLNATDILVEFWLA